MTYSGKIIQAYYHANSGITEQAKNVWMLNVPYVNIVETQGKSEQKEWTVRLSIKRLKSYATSEMLNRNEAISVMLRTSKILAYPQGPYRV